MDKQEPQLPKECDRQGVRGQGWRRKVGHGSRHRWCDKAMQEGLRQIRPEASGYTPTSHKSSVEWGLVIPSAAGRLPLSLCSVSHRCWLCGRPGLSPWLGHAVLDKLHNIHHHPPHSGPDSPRGLREGDGHHHVGRRPSQGICAGRMPEVSCWASGVGAGAGEARSAVACCVASVRYTTSLSFSFLHHSVEQG